VHKYDASFNLCVLFYDDCDVYFDIYFRGICRIHVMPFIVVLIVNIPFLSAVDTENNSYVIPNGRRCGKCFNL
jgi:hypothetical protein